MVVVSRFTEVEVESCYLLPHSLSSTKTTRNGENVCLTRQVVLADTPTYQTVYTRNANPPVAIYRNFYYKQ